MYKSKEIRKEQSIEKLKLFGIDYIENLPCTYQINEVKMKSLEQVARRYIANIISIHVACDLNSKADNEYTMSFFYDLLDKYGVRDELNELEKKVLDKSANESELNNVIWQYETLNVLAWILGLIKDLNFPNSSCDEIPLLEPIATCKDLTDFLDKCNFIDIESILDELDLEYRYHWALLDKRIDPSVNTGELNMDIVVERRRALEWLFSDEFDWNKLTLNV